MRHIGIEEFQNDVVAAVRAAEEAIGGVQQRREAAALLEARLEAAEAALATTRKHLAAEESLRVKETKALRERIQELEKAQLAVDLIEQRAPHLEPFCLVCLDDPSAECRAGDHAKDIVRIARDS